MGKRQTYLSITVQTFKRLKPQINPNVVLAHLYLSHRTFSTFSLHSVYLLSSWYLFNWLYTNAQLCGYVDDCPLNYLTMAQCISLLYSMPDKLQGCGPICVRYGPSTGIGMRFTGWMDATRAGVHHNVDLPSLSWAQSKCGSFTMVDSELRI